MDALVFALAPAFASGLAVQRLLDILDPWLDRLDQGKYKKLLLGVVSFAIGLGIAALTNIRVLKPLGATAYDSVDIVVTALIVSAGTESLNSILKFLSYKKAEQKAETVAKEAAVSKEALQAM
jgi:hypothetical protein